MEVYASMDEFPMSFRDIDITDLEEMWRERAIGVEQVRRAPTSPG